MTTYKVKLKDVDINKLQQYLWVSDNKPITIINLSDAISIAKRG